LKLVKQDIFEEKSFLRIVELIQHSRQRAFASVNRELINLYWDIGKYISKKAKSDGWGKGTVEKLAEFIQNKLKGMSGFSAQNLWRMKQFYEVYRHFPKLSPLVRQLGWTNNLHILSKTKTMEEKMFYLNLAVKEKYSKRELERQIDSGLFERILLSKVKVSTALKKLGKSSDKKKLSPVVRELRKTSSEEKLSTLLRELNKSSNGKKLQQKTVASNIQTQRNFDNVFKDTYVFEFLDLPKDFKEKDLRKALVKNLKEFILELGKGFSFIGEEYRLQVGNKDFFIDLLFYHRGLQCLVAIDLKTDEFSPEYLGKMNFYLEAIDKKQKLDHENPSVGLLLCKTKDEEVVRYAMNRSLSPSKVAEYETKLIDKEILKKKLHDLGEYYLLPEKSKTGKK
jgi:predicted nuclease of restriction endonuclease-like (RecB) superfamily